MGHGFVADDAVDGGNAGDVLLCADVVLKQPERKQNICHVTVLPTCFQALDKKNNVPQPKADKYPQPNAEKYPTSHISLFNCCLSAVL